MVMVHKLEHWDVSGIRILEQACQGHVFFSGVFHGGKKISLAVKKIMHQK